MFRWTTHRGDEWWYADRWGQASASAGPTSVSIDSIEPIDGQLTEARLHELLWTARQRFADATLSCYLDEVTRPLLDQLSSKTLLRWEPVQHPYSQAARVLAVQPFSPGGGSHGAARRPLPNDR